jgi:thiol-disulfide isomerase/thioredoxin
MNKFIFIAALLFLNLSIGFSQSKDLIIGDKAPEINLPNLKGETVKLSSLRDKIVLIDFWASWCSPCVKEQPKLAEMYKKYKNSVFKNGKEFEIYGVSFDNKRKSWESIINKYKINWIQVSDLQYWSSPIAKLYNIQELPYNLLIDGKGIIIAKNLHGAELEKALRKILKQDKK